MPPYSTGKGSELARGGPVSSKKKKPFGRGPKGFWVEMLVEDRGLEPLTFWLPARRSPN